MQPTNLTNINNMKRKTVDYPIDPSLFKTVRPRLETYWFEDIIFCKTHLSDIIERITKKLGEKNYLINFSNDTGIISGIGYDAFNEYNFKFKLICLNENNIDIKNSDLNTNDDLKYSWDNTIDVMEERNWVICYISSNEYGNKYQGIVSDIYQEFNNTKPVFRCYHNIGPYILSTSIFNKLNNLIPSGNDSLIMYNHYNIMDDINNIKMIMTNQPENDVSIQFNQLINSNYHELQTQFNFNELSFIALLKGSNEMIISIANDIIDKLNIYTDLKLFCTLFDLEKNSNLNFRSLPNMDKIIVFLKSTKSIWTHKLIHDRYNIDN